jgi:hypothetical protein
MLLAVTKSLPFEQNSSARADALVGSLKLAVL